MSVNLFASNLFDLIGCNTLNRPVPWSAPLAAPATSVSTELEILPVLQSSSSLVISDRPLPEVGEQSPIVVDPRPVPVVEERPLPTISDLAAPLVLDRTASLVTRSVPAADVSSLTASATNTSGLVTISNLAFSGKEGDSGTFQVRLNLSQAPTSNITLSFTTGNFLVVDADGNVSNGTQSSITFTPQNWNQTRTVWFIAEVDGVSTNRTTGNTINYALSGGTTFSGVYDLGTVTNTYAPDLSRYNIDLDFRNDTTGFWTAQRRAIAQKAANDWANKIGNELGGLQLNNSINLLENGTYSTNSFMTKRYVDDLVVYVNPLNSGGTAGGFGGPEYAFGGWSTTNPFPRVGQIAIDSAVGDTYLYNAVLHELGHVLGLLGLNLTSYLLEDLATPQTAVFKGAYATAANGGNYIPLQSQDGPNPVTGAYDYWHPSKTVNSVMSYGSIYTVSGPTAIDLAMLADSGYLVRGVNAPSAPTTTSETTTSETVAASVTILSRPLASLSTAAPPPPPQLAACNCPFCANLLALSTIGASNLSQIIEA